MNASIVQFAISTKKGESQPLRWFIVQETPHPGITSEGSALRWRNGGGLFREFGNPPKGIGARYYCHLLKPEGDLPADYSRRDFAGFEGNPGTIKFRGKDLGETSVHFDNNPSWPTIRLNGHDTPTSSERALFEQHVLPPLREAIAERKGVLFALACERIEKRMRDELIEARAGLEKLEREAREAMAQLRKEAA